MYKYNYPMSSMTADLIVTSRTEPLRILLIKRKNNPYQGMYALPGGFVDVDETTREAASRELFEETGLEIDSSRFIGPMLFDSVDRDPRQRTYSAAYKLFVEEGETDIVAGDDAKEVEWVRLDSILSNEINLAFDHRQIVDDFTR